jgi:hypothetical protein
MLWLWLLFDLKYHQIQLLYGVMLCSTTSCRAASAMTTAPTDQPIPTYLRGYDPSCISLLNNFGEVLMTNGFMMLPYEINHLEQFDTLQKTPSYILTSTVKKSQKETDLREQILQI